MGNTNRPAYRLSDIAVHPHARGEHFTTGSPTVTLSGSSPRTWGTPLSDPRGEIPVRFIPTHVGNTKNYSMPGFLEAVHPHARGEHNSRTKPLDFLLGSSPRTWGTRAKWIIVALIARFIPTHVGNTLERGITKRSASVHPHARGEHASMKCWKRSRIGSSPRTWGTLNPQLTYRGKYRFIPTHVGNTFTPHPDVR